MTHINFLIVDSNRKENYPLLFSYHTQRSNYEKIRQYQMRLKRDKTNQCNITSQLEPSLTSSLAN